MEMKNQVAKSNSELEYERLTEGFKLI